MQDIQNHIKGETTQKLTIVIPTCNRYPMLLRVLRYIDSVKPTLPILILDSSSDKPDVFRNALDELVQKYRMVWLHYENTISPTQKIKQGLEGVTTPCVVLWADDDFLIPASLIREVEFLEEHPDFDVVHGEAGIFTVAACGGVNEIESVSSYPQRSIIDETGAQRLIKHMQCYTTTFYSIHRTGNLRRHFSLCAEHKFGWMWAEIFLSCLAVIDGKTRKTSYLHMFREVHAMKDSWNENDGSKDFFDWIVSPYFFVRYEAFRDVLVAELVHVDEISVEDAREIVKQVFWGYLQKGLSQKYQQRYGHPTTMMNVKAALKRIYAAKSTWRFLQSLRTSPEHISLSSLLNPHSPYHEDFMPIYRVVTSSPEMI